MKKIILSFLFLFFAASSIAQYVVQTYCGSGQVGLTDSTLLYAQFNKPTGMCRDMFGNFFIADASNNCIRKIDLNGQVSTFAGAADSGYVNGPASIARFYNPFSICADDSGNIYVSDFLNQRIRKISSTGFVSTIAGSGIAGFIDGPDSIARFNYPRGIAIDHSGNIFVADSWNHRIRKIEATTHSVSTYAGGGNAIGVGSVGSLVNGIDSVARFYTPVGIAIDSSGNLYIADAYNHRIRLIDTIGQVSVFAGSGLTGQNNGGYVDGLSTNSRFNVPTEVYYSANNNLLVSDTYNHRIRMISSNGDVTTIAGNGIAGLINGNSSTAEFHFPRAIIDNGTNDSIWVVDGNNNVIRLITSINSFINEINNPLVSISPNPVMNFITIKFPNTTSFYELNIVNLVGRIVYTRESINNEYLNLSVEQLLPGAYFLWIKNDEKPVVYRFNKN